MLSNKLLMTVGGEETLYSDDVFQSYTRTGTGADVVVTTGIDMTKGYMLWSKGRSGATDHAIYDSARGVTFDLASNTTAAQTTQTTGLKAVSSTGHTVGSLTKMNTSSATYVDWIFRKSPKFFDVVTYTGNDTAGRTIAHSLGVAPGMFVIKRIDTGAPFGDWHVYHRSVGATKVLRLNATDAEATSSLYFNNTAPTSSVFTLGNASAVNASGGTYVAYLFAHDSSTDGIVQCGSYVGNGGAGNNVTLGFEPQYLLIKQSSSAGTQWFVFDAARGLSMSTSAWLEPNTANAEGSLSNVINPTATGFTINTGISGLNTASATHVYLAIRRPNKPPTVGTQVYSAIARTGTGAAATVTGVGFAPDLVLSNPRSAVYEKGFTDRLRGATIRMRPHSTAAEITDSPAITSLNMDGISLGADGTWGSVNLTGTYINHFFKRAPGVFDVVCYNGTGANLTVTHNLTVAPEFVISKRRGGADFWYIYTAGVGNTKALSFDTAAASAASAGYWNNTTPTVTGVTFGTTTSLAGNTHVAYLFATKAGISKVGSYTGNATTNTINCGFTTGARFVLIKRTDSTGDWYVWDTVRGIIAGNDPYLLLNSTAAEVTSTDYIDPVSTGFELSSTAPAAINASGGTYIYLAFA